MRGRHLRGVVDLARGGRLSLEAVVAAVPGREAVLAPAGDGLDGRDRFARRAGSPRAKRSRPRERAGARRRRRSGGPSHADGRALRRRRSRERRIELLPDERLDLRGASSDERLGRGRPARAPRASGRRPGRRRSARRGRPGPRSTRGGLADARAWTRSRSCSSWRSPPRRTASIMTFSVARKGISASSRRRATSGCTTSPPKTFSASTRIASVVRNASGTAMRLLAESSSVRSSHCVAAVIAVSIERAMTWRASAHMRSARMGLRL